MIAKKSPHNLNKVVIHKKFKKDIKTWNWYFRKDYNIFLKINNKRLSLTHDYICNLLLVEKSWDIKLEQNKYLRFLINAEEFKCFLEEEQGLKDAELGRCFMSLLRLTDKHLMTHILLKKLTKNHINDINNDLNKWFKMSFKNNDKIFKDYCWLVSYLNKLNKIHGTIKTEQDFKVKLEEIEVKEKLRPLPKYLEEPDFSHF